jgi:hypothetical protein
MTNPGAGITGNIVTNGGRVEIRLLSVSLNKEDRATLKSLKHMLIRNQDKRKRITLLGGSVNETCAASPAANPSRFDPHRTKEKLPIEAVYGKGSSHFCPTRMRVGPLR